MARPRAGTALPAPGATLPRPLSEARQGKLLVIGYAGNTAVDHVDQLHTLPAYLRRLDWKQPKPAGP